MIYYFIYETRIVDDNLNPTKIVCYGLSYSYLVYFYEFYSIIVPIKIF